MAPGWRTLAILRHRLPGQPPHLDLVFAGGPRGPTLALDLGSVRTQGRPTLRLQSPHRRRYLAYRGPVPMGRGTAVHLWQGLVLVRALRHDQSTATSATIVAKNGETMLMLHPRRVVLAPLLLRLLRCPSTVI